MNKPKHYLQSNPIRNWKIAEDVEKVFIGTVERAQRWESIKIKNQPTLIVATPHTKVFNQNIN